MACCFWRGASAPISTTTRSRPVITGGPVRTLRTDTGQIIRAGASQIGSGKSGALFNNSMWALGRSLGLNTMRCGVNSSTLSMSLATLLANIDDVVELARVNRMYAMIGYFAATPGDWEVDVPGNTARWITFWSAAGERYKDKPWVFFELFNEPTGVGTVSTYSAAEKQGLKQVYDAARAAAPNTVIAFPSPANLSPSAAQYITLMQSFDALGNGVPIDWTKTVLGYHYYNQTFKFAVSGGTANAADEGEAGLRAIFAIYPGLMTETNWWVATPKDPAARHVLINGLDVMERIGCGWTLLRSPGQVGDIPAAFPGDLFPDPLANKIAQLRTRGFYIPVE